MEDDNFLPRLIFGDEAAFRISGKANVTMFEYVDSKIHKRFYNITVILRKLTCFAPFSREKFTKFSFLRKTQFLNTFILKCYSNDFFPKSIKILKI